MENGNSATTGNETGEAQPASAKQSGSHFPQRLIAFSFLCLAIVLVLRFGYETLNEWFNLNPGIANAIQLLLLFLVACGWNVWIAFFSRWRWVSRLVGVGLLGILPIAGFVFFQPIFDGDLGFVRFDPRFGAWKKEYAQVQQTPVVDQSDENLLQSSEFDFPQFLGPDRNATVSNVVLTDSWDSESPKKVWTINVGEGWAGFSVVGDRAFTQEQRDDQEMVVCYDIKSGTQLWAYSSTRRHEDISAMGRVGPRATPTVIDGRLYANSATGVLDCVDAKTGELIWSVDVPALVNIDQITRLNGRGLEYTQENSSLTWGRSGSPLVYNDVVVVPAGGPVGGDAVTMIALDCQTGEERWRGGERASSYGSPTLIQVEDEVHVCLVAEDHAVGHDPETGTELWAHPWPGHSDADASCSQITSIDGSLLLLSKGYGVGGQVIRLTRQGEQWQTETFKSNPRVLKTKMTNPVIFEGHAYSLSDGFLECAEIPSLKRKWKKRGRFGNGQLLLVGDKLLVHGEKGTLHLVAASPEKFQELGKIDTIDGVCWNTIALSGDRLLVRSELEAAMIRVPLAMSADQALGEQTPVPSE